MEIILSASNVGTIRADIQIHTHKHSHIHKREEEKDATEFKNKKMKV